MIKSTFTALTIAALLTIFSGSSPAQAQRIPCAQTNLCGQPLFAITRIYAFDETGQRVIDPSDHKFYSVLEGFATYTTMPSGWEQWVTRDASHGLLTGMRYYVDVPRRTITIAYVRFRHITSASNSLGYRLVNFPEHIPFKIDSPPLVIRLHGSPEEAAQDIPAMSADELKRAVQSGWWKHILAGKYYYPYSPGSPGTGEGPPGTLGTDPRCFSSDPWNPPSGLKC